MAGSASTGARPAGGAGWAGGGEARAAVAWGLRKPSRRVLCPGGHPPTSREQASPIPTSPTGHGGCPPTPGWEPGLQLLPKPVCTLHSSRPDALLARGLASRGPGCTRGCLVSGGRWLPQAALWCCRGVWRGWACTCVRTCVYTHDFERVPPLPHAGSGPREGSGVLGSLPWAGSGAGWQLGPWAGSSGPCCLWVEPRGGVCGAAPGPRLGLGACVLWKAASIPGAVLRTRR